MANKVRSALERGDVVMGMMHFTGSPMIVEVMARAGLDFFIIDMEHSPIDLALAAHLVRAADAAGITPFVRVPEVDPGLIKKMLNLGVQGIVIPHADRAACQAAVQAVRFAPEGTRGSCPSIRSANYGPPDWKEYTRRANREILVIPLLEETGTVDDIEAIVAIPGVDIVFLGPFDLSVSAGVPGAGFDHPLIAAALDRVVAHARGHRKYVMTSVGDQINTDYGRHILSRGVQMISYSADALVFLKACREIAALKAVKTLTTL
jgi:2-keto-3-deoxy-L-rhamnonate aldolase RhmA